MAAKCPFYPLFSLSFDAKQQEEVGGGNDELKKNEFLSYSGQMVFIAMGFVVLITIGLVMFTIAPTVKNHKAHFHKEEYHQTLMIGLVIFSIASFVSIHTADGKSLNKSVALLYTNKNDNHDHVVKSVSMSHPGICVSKVFAAHNDDVS
jgi:hypothetical protein